MRPQQHIIDDQGDVILRSALVEWGINRIQRDYGSDYTIEVFQDEQSTGLFINAQLKSSTVTAYSADLSFISERLDMDDAHYLTNLLKQATFLFHADVNKKQLYWSAIQLDTAVVKTLETKDTKSLTVRIPTANKLPQEWNRFLHDIDAVLMILLQRGLILANATDFVAAMHGQPLNKQDELAENLLEKANRVKLQAAHVVFRQGNIEESKRRLTDILRSSDASVDIRFNGTVQLGDIEWSEIMTSGKPQVRASEQLLKTGRELQAIARNGPKHLKLYALMVKMAGQLSVLVHKHHGLSMNWIAHRKTGRDPLWMLVLTSELNANSVVLRRKYNQCLRLVGIAAKSPRRLVLGESIVKLVREIPALVGIFLSSGFPKIAEQYRQSAYELLRMAAALAIDNSDDDLLLSVTMQAFIVDSVGGVGQIAAWARSLVEERWQVGNEYRDAADQMQSNIRQRKAGIRLKGDIVTTERQIMENLLSAAGYDPSAEPWSGLIDLAVKDHDLGRALKGCEHTFITPGRMPQIFRRMGLELAGPKVLHCTLHRYRVEGKELDTVTHQFTTRYCNNCKDRLPRSAVWAYDHEFQGAENQKWIDQGFQ